MAEALMARSPSSGMGRASLSASPKGQNVSTITLPLAARRPCLPRRSAFSRQPAWPTRPSRRPARQALSLLSAL